MEGYREAEIKRQEAFNEKAWLQGMYFYDALCCALKNAFGSKGSAPAKYPQKPYPTSFGKKEEEQEIQEENERLKAELYMRNMVRAGRSWAKGKGQ